MSATARSAKTVPRPYGEAPTGERESPVYRSADWLAAVRSLGVCVLCGARGVQAAHRNEDKAKGRRVDDCLVASLCPACHYAIDQGKEMTRDERRSTLDRAIVLTLRELVRNGAVTINPERRKTA